MERLPFYHRHATCVVRLYIRVSTTEQADEGYSVSAQERMARLYAAMHYPDSMIKVYADEGYSGRSAERPAFTRLNNDLKPGDVVIVHKLDRFARNVHLLLSSVEDYNKRNIRFVSITEQIDFSTPIGKVMLALLAAFAQYYTDNLSEETAKGLKEKAQKGLWTGPVPIGYRKKTGSKGELELTDDATTVREIFRLYVEEGFSYREIAHNLNHRGLTAYHWRTKARAPWCRESVRVVICNSAYMGKVSSGGIEFDGSHPPIISPELFQLAAAQRAHNARCKR